MEQEKLEALLIDYIDGKLTEEEQQLVEKEMAQREEVKKLYEQLKEVMQGLQSMTSINPPETLRLGFDKILHQEIVQPKKGSQILFHPNFYRIAAAVLLLVLGGGVGFWISKENRQASELEAMRKEMEVTKQMLISMLGNQQSASQRVIGATVAYNDIEKADDEVVDALIYAMNEDTNTNVRIAALEALGKFRKQPDVRLVLIKSLRTQKDPLVQIALIRLLVEMKEESISTELQRISTDEETLPAVKDEAYAGLLKLS